MRASLGVLIAALTDLDVPLNIDLLLRRQAQFAIYVAQALGADFGYNFSWSEDGPYSSKLADNLDDAARKLAVGVDVRVPSLAIPYKEALSIARSTLRPPNGSTASSFEWASTLATLHFLKTHAGERDPLEKFKSLRTKRRLAPGDFDFAKQSIERLAAAV